jgi:multisubunit Na+/H+ antiporter MnhE subunit
MRRDLGLLTALVAIWVLAWGALTWANLLSGVAIGVAVLAVPSVRRATHLPVVRPLPALALVAHVLREVVVSNAQIARQALARRPRIATGVVRVPLAGCSDEALSAVANLVAMTPGIMTVEVTKDPTVIYVHVLHLEDPDDVRRSIWRLRDRVVRAFGTAEARATVEQGPGDGAEGGRP